MWRKSSNKATYINPITIRGQQALSHAGIPQEFAAQIMMICEKFGITIAIRAGAADQLYDRDAQPKRSDTKAKTGNIFPAGVITEDPEIGRLTEDGMPLNVGLKVPKETVTTHYKPSLRKLILLSQENPPRIFMKPQADGTIHIARNSAITPGKNELLFRISLDNPIPPAEVIKDYKQYVAVMSRIPQMQVPEWWQTGWGDFNKLLDCRFELEVKKPGDHNFSAVKILAYNNKGKITPITSDMDLLFISKPCKDTELLKIARKLSLPIFTPVNTFKDDGTEKMHGLLMALAKNDPERMVDISQITPERVKMLGNLSPFEAYVIFAINQRFANFVKHLDELFQHGPENRNPGKPSKIDDTMLHFIEGEALLTQDESQMIDLMINRFEPYNYLETYEFTIHPKWDITPDKWGKVVARIIKDGKFTLPDDVLDAYAGHNKLKRSVSSVSVLSRKLSRSLSQIFKRRNSAEQSPLTASPKRKHYNNAQLPELITFARTADTIWKPSASLTKKENSQAIKSLCDAESTEEISWRCDDFKLIKVCDNNQNTLFEIQLNPVSISVHADELSLPMVQAVRTILNRISSEEDLIADFQAHAEPHVLSRYEEMQQKFKKSGAGF